MLNTVIFDMDGVLVDSETYHERYLTDVCLNLGIHIKKDDFEALRGTTAEHFWKYISNKYGPITVTPIFIENVRIGYLDYLKSLETIKPIDGVIELLEVLESLAIQKVVASSASRIRVEALIEMIGMSKYFSAKISGQDVKKGKPSPDIFLISAQKIGSKAEECVVIEDSPNGIAAAKAAGMKCIGFSGSGTKAEKLSDSDLVINNFNELTSVLESKRSFNHLFPEKIQKSNACIPC